MSTKQQKAKENLLQWHFFLSYDKSYMDCLGVKLGPRSKKYASNHLNYNTASYDETSCCLRRMQQQCCYLATNSYVSCKILVFWIQIFNWVVLPFSSDSSQWVKNSVYWNKSQTQGRNWFLGDPPPLPPKVPCVSQTCYSSSRVAVGSQESWTNIHTYQNYSLL
jgi:hypothetical protein